MTRKGVRRLRKSVAALSAGMMFASLTCVQSAVETVGSGLTFGGTSGLLGLGSPAAIAAGTGLDFLVDLTRLFLMGR